ncbi:hypothetical protein RV14_GL002378 [Enterococcus ratti]|uniref:Uncharacterized protein n=1 Tax=Enterococcus ratti TaxID=150033 RepID=A0A1L8WLD2_9ENTE|nr:hypothetical protein RV14_GL002378 [Enterococcus ratti]
MCIYNQEPFYHETIQGKTPLRHYSFLQILKEKSYFPKNFSLFH